MIKMSQILVIEEKKRLTIKYWISIQ